MVAGRAADASASDMSSKRTAKASTFASRREVLPEIVSEVSVVASGFRAGRPTVATARRA